MAQFRVSPAGTFCDTDTVIVGPAAAWEAVAVAVTSSTVSGASWEMGVPDPAQLGSPSPQRTERLPAAISVLVRVSLPTVGVVSTLSAW